MEYSYKDFILDKVHIARWHQACAYYPAINLPISHYESAGYVYDLIRCSKFLNLHVIFRNDGTASGIIGLKNYVNDVKLFSISPQYVVIGHKDNTCRMIIAKYNYIIEYDKLRFIEIQKGENVWYDKDNKMIISLSNSCPPPVANK